ncbi:hypothetical protein EDD15DRAFT_2245345 [Pisolithus albus]|nr:hypothetical protein EDD15DRAFT_2245345 [Pisolithus albus]
MPKVEQIWVSLLYSCLTAQTTASPRLIAETTQDDDDDSVSHCKSWFCSRGISSSEPAALATVLWYSVWCVQCRRSVESTPILGTISAHLIFSLFF